MGYFVDEDTGDHQNDACVLLRSSVFGKSIVVDVSPDADDTMRTASGSLRVMSAESIPYNVVVDLEGDMISKQKPLFLNVLDVRLGHFSYGFIASILER